MTIDEVLGHASHSDLPGDCNLRIGLKRDGRPCPVGVVKDDCDGGARDACLPTLVDEILQVGGSDCAHVCDTENEADGVEDVGLATAVEARDGVEGLIEARDVGADRVRLEAIDDELFDAHDGRVGARCPAALSLVVGTEGRSRMSWRRRRQSREVKLVLVRRTERRATINTRKSSVAPERAGGP